MFFIHARFPNDMILNTQNEAHSVIAFKRVPAERAISLHLSSLPSLLSLPDPRLPAQSVGHEIQVSAWMALEV
jgi:hypothetical protein